jgi:hypothetical protein
MINFEGNQSPAMSLTDSTSSTIHSDDSFIDHVKRKHSKQITKVKEWARWEAS